MLQKVSKLLQTTWTSTVWTMWLRPTASPRPPPTTLWTLLCSPNWPLPVIDKSRRPREPSTGTTSTCRPLRPTRERRVRTARRWKAACTNCSTTVFSQAITTVGWHLEIHVKWQRTNDTNILLSLIDASPDRFSRSVRFVRHLIVTWHPVLLDWQLL